MRRKGIGFLGLLTVIGFLCQPAAAGERKSSSQREVKAVLAEPAVNTTAAPNRRPGSSAIGLFETGVSDSGEGRSTEQNPVHQPLTLLRFNSQFGEVAVRPVIGKVNGAQFSLQF